MRDGDDVVPLWSFHITIATIPSSDWTETIYLCCLPVCSDLTDHTHICEHALHTHTHTHTFMFLCVYRVVSVPGVSGIASGQRHAEAGPGLPEDATDQPRAVHRSEVGTHSHVHTCTHAYACTHMHARLCVSSSLSKLVNVTCEDTYVFSDIIKDDFAVWTRPQAPFY